MGERKLPAAPALKGSGELAFEMAEEEGGLGGPRGESERGRRSSVHDVVYSSELSNTVIDCFLEALDAAYIYGANADDLGTRSSCCD